MRRKSFLEHEALGGFINLDITTELYFQRRGEYKVIGVNILGAKG